MVGWEKWDKCVKQKINVCGWVVWLRLGGYSLDSLINGCLQSIVRKYWRA